jgi:hypothetical protein
MTHNAQIQCEFYKPDDDILSPERGYQLALHQQVDFDRLDAFGKSLGRVLALDGGYIETSALEIPKYFRSKVAGCLRS